MNRNRSGRRYDREFKNNAVALVRGGRTITEVARDLGVSKWSLGQCVRRAEEGQLLSEAKTLTLERPEQRELRRLRQELEYMSRQRDILKKALHLVGGDATARFTMMEKFQYQYGSDALSKALEVSESGFAAHRGKQNGQRWKQDAELRVLIAQSFEQSRNTYGSPRVRLDLRELGHRCGKNRVARLMRESGLRARQKRRSDLAPLRAAIITRSQKTGWQRCRRRIARASSGKATSPPSRPRKAGFIWPLPSMAVRAAASLTLPGKHAR